jgi:hypothetical protein
VAVGDPKDFLYHHLLACGPVTGQTRQGVGHSVVHALDVLNINSELCCLQSDEGKYEGLVVVKIVKG